MSYNIILRADTLRSLAFGSITGSYVAVGTAFTHPIRLIKIQNLTDATLLISFDGTTDNDVLYTNSFALYDFTTNQVNTAGAFIATGTVIYVKQSGVPSAGSVYITAFYGKGD